MSFFDDASLAFLPRGAAGKDGKAYSIKPTDGTGDFTFSRGSNLAATRVGADGLIEKGRENLLTQSNRFDLWNIQNVTSGHAGYDGTNDAYLQSGSSRLQRTLSLSTGVYTASVYVKAGFSNYVQFRMAGSPTVVTRFELIGNGTKVFDNGSISATIEPIANTDWYRINLTLNTAPSSFRIYPENDLSGTQTADSSIYIQDAQLELGTIATDYIESGATTGKAGLLEDEPRFDYSGGATCPSLLLEPSRTNLIKYSEYFGAWSFIGATANSNVSVSPDGYQNAGEVIGDGSSTSVRTYIPVATSAGVNTFSCFLKAGTANFGYLEFSGFAGIGGTKFAYFDLVNGTTPTSGATIEDYGNGWYRCSITANIDAGDVSGNAMLRAVPNTATASFPSANDANGKSILVWGAQLEEGSYQTSYIQNHSGGSVTRNADVISLTGASALLGDSAGGMFMEASAFDVSEGNIISISDGTNGNRVQIGYPSSGAIGELQYVLASGGSLQFATNDGNTYLDNTFYKTAIRYAVNDAKAYVDGSQVISNTSLNTFSDGALTIFRFGDPDNSPAFYGRIRQLVIFDQALLDEELSSIAAYASFTEIANANNYTING